MATINRIEVVIDRVVYELSSSESIEYIQAVATYIDRKIKSIYSARSEAAINPRLKTLFISLNIADDLFKEKDKIKVVELKHSNLEKEFAAAKEENGKLKKDNQDMKTELKAAKAEIEKLKQELDERMEEELKRDKKLATINGGAAASASTNAKKQ